MGSQEREDTARASEVAGGDGLCALGVFAGILGLCVRSRPKVAGFCFGFTKHGAFYGLVHWF